MDSSVITSGKKEKGPSCKCELVEYHSLPSYLKDNEFILDYYRAEWPLKQTILSIFSIHNETLNIWTHLIGFFVFLALTICTGMMIQRDASTVVINFMGGLSMPTSKYIIPSLPSIPQRCSATNHTDDPCHLMNVKDDHELNPAITPSAPPLTRWPLFTFLSGAMFCLLSSSACHLLSCHSKLYSYIMLRLDYTGISALIVTSFYPLVYYSFLCHSLLRNLYIGFITAFGAATTMVSLLPVFQTSNFRTVRSGLFFLMGASGFVPIVHKVILFGHQSEALLTTGYELVMGAFYVFGVAVYVARVPERWRGTATSCFMCLSLQELAHTILEDWCT